MAKEDDLPFCLVRRLLDYDAATGILHWNKRSPDLFVGKKYSAERACATWNGKFAGTIAASFSHGYSRLRIMGRDYTAHRVIWCWMTGEWPENDIDHANMDRSDNRWLNLRNATRSQNMANIKAHKDSTLGIKGVAVHKYSGRIKYRARIRRNGQNISLGLFDAPELAGQAYWRASTEIDGEFARSECER